MSFDYYLDLFSDEQVALTTKNRDMPYGLLIDEIGVFLVKVMRLMISYNGHINRD